MERRHEKTIGKSPQGLFLRMYGTGKEGRVKIIALTVPGFPYKKTPPLRAEEKKAGDQSALAGGLSQLPLRRYTEKMQSVMLQVSG